MNDIKTKENCLKKQDTLWAKINSALKTLVENGYLDEQMGLTKKAGDEMKKKRPKNAVILAAGFGMRMVPSQCGSSERNFGSPW